jgi:quercetin dioxygenase-like cupin family protein
MMVPGLERWDEERCGPPTEDAIRARLEALGYRASRFVYPPGTFFPEHTHPMDKIDAVVSGRFRMILEETEVILEAGVRLAVPKGKAHSAEVVGDAPVVSLDAIRAGGGSI